MDICLFNSIDEVQTISDNWLNEYNNDRPHESLKNMPPIEFLHSWADIHALEDMSAIAHQWQNTENLSPSNLS